MVIRRLPCIIARCTSSPEPPQEEPDEPGVHHADHHISNPSNQTRPKPRGLAGSGLPPRPPKSKSGKGGKDGKPSFAFAKPPVLAILGSYGATTGDDLLHAVPHGPGLSHLLVRWCLTLVVHLFPSPSGLVGTLAFGAAWATHMSLPSMFHMGNQLPNDLDMAAVIVSPLLALNALIMIPDWNSWKLPKLDAKDTDTMAPLLPRRDLSTGSLAASSQGRNDSPSSEPALSTSASTSSSAPTALPDKMVPAAQWGKSSIDGMAMMKRVKDAMHLAQGHYTANNPTGSLTFANEVAIAAVHSLAAELLYRGVAVSLLGEWLCDRYYEAGADDVINLPAWLHDGNVTTPEAAKWSAAVALVGISALFAIRRVGLIGEGNLGSGKTSLSRQRAEPLVFFHFFCSYESNPFSGISASEANGDYSRLAQRCCARWLTTQATG